tara:strand:- start:8713 stop:10887 length:2175 start_codon:yes stop_codon:yes gene_type:complete
MFKKSLHNNAQLFLCFIVLLALAGCSDTKKETINASGSAIKGVITSGIVRVFSSSQNKQLLGETRTNQFGQFTINLPDALPEKLSDTFLIFELSADKDTRMKCDLSIGCINTNGGQVDFGDNIELPSSFKLLGIAENNGTSHIEAYISPLSHLIVSTALKNSQILNEESVRIATKWVNNALKLSQSPIKTQIKDITQLPNLPLMTEEQLKQSILSAAMYPETISLEWSLGDASIDTINLKDILSRASELAADLASLIEENNPSQALALNRIQHDTTAQSLTLNAAAITIFSQPSSVILTQNDAFELYVQAFSDLRLSYQWYKNGYIIPGANSATYTKSSSNLNDAGIYHVVISNGDSELRSLITSVTVNAPARALQITQQPQGLSITEGDAILLSANASGDGKLQYQWQKNGSLIPGANSSHYYLPSSQIDDAGSYRVVISNNSSQINSNFAKVWISPAVQAVSISQQPQSLIVTEGNKAVFKVSASGGGFIRYQWRKNGVAIENAFSPSLSISSVSQSNNGTYDVIISNSQGSLRSKPVSLSVLDKFMPVMITDQPQSQTIISGSPFTLSVSSTNKSDLRYQWFLEGNAIDAANSAQYQVLSASYEDQGQYTVLVSTINSTELSEAAGIIVNQAPLSTIELTWDTPRAREDGSTLHFDEIQGYLIEYGNKPFVFNNNIYVDKLLPNSLRINDLTSGLIFFRIATIDSDNRQGAFSEVISVTIP